MPSLAKRAGDFSGVADQSDRHASTVSTGRTCSRSGSATPVSAGEPYYTPGCTSAAQCVFPNARFRSARGRRRRSSCCSTSRTECRREHVLDRRVRADGARRQGSFRARRQHARFGLLTGYYFLDDYTLDNPYPGQQGGANVPGFDALTIGRAQLWSFGSAKTFGPNTVNDFHASLTHNANNVGRAERRPRREPRVAGVRHRSRHARHRRPGAAVRRRREHRVQHVHDGRDDHRRQSDRRHAASQRQRLESVRRAHREGRRPVPVPAGAAASRTRRSTARSRLPAPKPDRTSPTSCSACPSNYIQSSGGVFYLRNQYGGRVRAGQLARALEPDAQLRPALGHHGAVVREGQPDPDDRARAAVGGVSRTRRRVSCSRATRASSRGLSPARFGNVSPRLGVAYSPSEQDAACAPATDCSTPRSRGCRRASCTACRRTATTI